MALGVNIPPEETKAHECIMANFAGLYRFLSEFQNSVALFEYLERGGGPPSDGVLGGQFTIWRMLAARDGALNIYHFKCLCGWLPCCKDFLTAWRLGRVQSCVRPVDAVVMTAGLDGFRGSGPILLSGLLRPGHLSGCPHPRSDRFAITSHRPPRDC